MRRPWWSLRCLSALVSYCDALLQCSLMLGIFCVPCRQTVMMVVMNLIILIFKYFGYINIFLYHSDCLA